jgi:hypothetical protein
VLPRPVLRWFVVPLAVLSVFQPMAKSNFAKRPRSFLFNLGLWLFLSLASASASVGQPVRRPPVTPLGPGLSFAIADLDGDLYPDLVTVHTATNNSGTTEYLIQLRLSAAGQRSIRFVAPAGGLQIEARDVNDNHAIDLVVRTAWFKQPVAIFLNDGHGGFSRVEPTAFPDAFSECMTAWTLPSKLAIDLSCVAPQPNVGICGKEVHRLHERRPAQFVLPYVQGFSPGLFLVSGAGRAPPSVVL